MEVKILGTGCPKCQRLEQLAREAAAEAGLQVVEVSSQIRDFLRQFG